MRFESVLENPFGRFKTCSLEICGCLHDMTIMSTVNKDRKYTSACRTEYAYLFNPPVYEAEKMDDLDERFEKARRLAYTFDFDAVDDTPFDRQLVQVLELFRGSQSSVSLILARQSDDDQGDMDRHFRRIGICLHPSRSHSLQATYEQEFMLV